MICVSYGALAAEQESVLAYGREGLFREGEGMENKVMKFYSKAGNNIILRAIPGHFATSHSHINYYVDMTGLKTRRSEAAAVGKAFVQRLPIETVWIPLYVWTVVRSSALIWRKNWKWGIFLP